MCIYIYIHKLTSTLADRGWNMPFSQWLINRRACNKPISNRSMMIDIDRCYTKRALLFLPKVHYWKISVH